MYLTNYHMSIYFNEKKNKNKTKKQNNKQTKNKDKENLPKSKMEFSNTTWEEVFFHLHFI